MLKNNKRGFTLIELLIVIAVIGFLAAAILVAVDPVKRIQDSRDSQRESEVQGILDAILKKQVDDVAQFDGTGTAQVSTITLTGSSGTYGVTINGTLITQAFTGTLAASATALDAAIDASAVASVVTASSSGAIVTVTSDFPGTAFTIAKTDQGSGDADETVATPTANGAGAGIDDDNTTSQVIVSSTASVACDTPSTAPACDDDGALSLNTDAGTGCIADLSGLVSEYIAEIPIDPLDGTTPTVGNLVIGTTNSGYYINRTASGRLTIGACYGEQDSNIKTSR